MNRILLWTTCFVLSLCLFACTPLVKTDLKSFNANPEEYKGKRVVLTTDLRSLAEKPEDYLGKDVEVTGYVKPGRLRSSGDWGFVLEDEEGRSVRCYEWKYRAESWIMPSMALKRAASQKGQVTVVGKLEKDLEIELDSIEYEGIHYDTDYIPYTAYRSCHPYYNYYHCYGFPNMGGSWCGKGSR